MSRRHLAMLLVLAALWGASFMFIKIGDRELQPITLVGFRMALGALTLIPIVLVNVGARRTLRELRGAAWPLVVTGLLNSAIPIFAITWAETRLDSGLTALIQLPSQLTGWKVTASVLTLGIAGTGVAYVLYYGLISGAGASRAILITYLVPTFAVVYGALLLGEPVTAAAIGGLALVLAGVGLGTGAIRPGRSRRLASSET